MPCKLANADPDFSGALIAILNQMNNSTHSVNWLEGTSRLVSSRFPQIGNENAKYIANRLSILLLERLSQDTRAELVECLPSGEVPTSFEKQSASEANHLVGYTDFVDLAARSFFGESNGLVDSAPEIADIFLWSVAQGLTPDLKWKLAEELPADVRSRMNLRAGGSDDSKVA